MIKGDANAEMPVSATFDMLKKWKSQKKRLVCYHMDCVHPFHKMHFMFQW